MDPLDFRRTIGLFASGVAVVATDLSDGVHAMTASAVSSLSLSPALVLLCPAKKSRFSSTLRPGRPFTINFLRADQEALAIYFAGAWREPQAPPFRFVPGASAPRLQGCLASIECDTREIIEGGDHWVVVGEVRALFQGIEPHHPLVFFKGRFRGIDPERGRPAPDLVAVEEEPAHVYYG
ncbi:MAG TPA: flavin reductase family protein [Steroidobacteraceae bacterium]